MTFFMVEMHTLDPEEVLLVVASVVNVGTNCFRSAICRVKTMQLELS